MTSRRAHENQHSYNGRSVSIARPKYYEMDGALRANANRAWLLAFLTIPIALLAIGFAIFVRMQPPTVIRIGPNGDASVAGQACEGRCHGSCHRRDGSVSG